MTSPSRRPILYVQKLSWIHYVIVTLEINTLSFRIFDILIGDITLDINYTCGFMVKRHGIPTRLHVLGLRLGRGRPTLKIKNGVPHIRLASETDRNRIRKTAPTFTVSNGYKFMIKIRTTDRIIFRNSLQSRQSRLMSKL